MKKIIVIAWLCIAFACPAVLADEGSSFTPDDQAYLLKLARDTIETYLRDGVIPAVKEKDVPKALREKRGCFVTLHKGPGHRLRGCIGTLVPRDALYRSVMMNAINAAVKDHRFAPVKIDEMTEIDIEVSVLSVPKALAFKGGGDLVDKLRPGVDGVILFYGRCRATFLPQVWEQLPEPEQFLSRLCSKDGCPEHCWKKEGLRIETYQAEYFSEPAAAVKSGKPAASKKETLGDDR